ncbi:Piso0_002038 [Millerozyma farinosa CBS 7064]|uniref:Piso0_002038 protein n=1 Tax=Pichia sorbitophila (strain ATCC MYA-4447 / BCRC 22081 / CBS 7064 / NBRC 10061 / NRRL Y-12695) TaxID=559304 RepID=G8YBI7_PICSO|nr:Piso0_002038 [Millerozyma farinosa CBS 7064]
MTTATIERKENVLKTVCVFCGSSFGNNDSFVKAADTLGKLLAERKWGLVYGGGSTGIMGSVARACATNDGYVHGIIPEALIARERTSSTEGLNEKLKESINNHDGSTPLPDSKEYGHTTLVKDMHTRKRMMGEEADAFVALPGGYGTLEELMEVVTWFQLNIHNKPIIIYNVDGFYDGLMQFIQDAIKSEFVSAKNGEIIKIAYSAEEVLEAIEKYRIPDGRFNLKWDST